MVEVAKATQRDLGNRVPFLFEDDMPNYIVKAIESREIFCRVDAGSPEEARKKAFTGDLIDQWDGDYLDPNEREDWVVELDD